MTTGSQSITIEGFVTDNAFINQSHLINNILTDDGVKVGALTTKALSYFSKPSIFADSRLPTDRHVNWVAQSSPKMIIDQDSFGTFVTTVNNLPTSTPVGFFKLIDKLLFNYNSTVTHAALEAALIADTDIASIYVPGSFSLSSIILSDTIYPTSTTSASISVPASVTFSVELASGSTTSVFVLKLFTSVDAWLAEYNISNIVKVIPSLPYTSIYNSSLINTTDNIFSTATLTATLSFTTTQVLIGNISVSGIVEYRAILTDGVNSAAIPFNILFKGRPPTLFEIRSAIKAEILGSGVGNAAGWKARIPGVFVDGRFYIIPFWDKTYTKPDQIVFPNIGQYLSYGAKTNQIVSSLGYGDISQNMDLFSVYYNHMTASVIPDLSGTVAIHHLTELIPDYQSYSTNDEQFAYMLPLSQLFSSTLNTILTVDSGAMTSSVYVPNTEGSLSFYSFTLGSYEICVITKLCYNTILGSSS